MANKSFNTWQDTEQIIKKGKCYLKTVLLHIESDEKIAALKHHFGITYEDALVVRGITGHIDILCANAGVSEFAPLGTITEAQFDKIFSVNVKGLLFTVQKALPLFHDGGSIILNGSIGASKGVGTTSVYSATKAAIRSFARTWTVDLKHRKIRVNAISPGPIDTPIFNSLAKTEEEVKQIKANLVTAVPMGRMGTADEIAKAVSFLASDDSSYITGIELFVDGGMAQI